MKPAIPREIIDACGGFEEDHWSPCGRRRVTGDEFRDARDLEVVEPAHESAFEALGEEFFYHQGNYLL